MVILGAWGEEMAILSNTSTGGPVESPSKYDPPQHFLTCEPHA